MSKPLEFTRLLTENRISNERHSRELAELHEGWKLRETELLAHIERLEANQIPEGFVAVPVEPTPEMIEAAEDAHMPFGDMELAIRMAILAAIDATQTQDGGGV